jgi:hypothetical protein
LKRPHFTLKGLMIAIVLIGVGIAALVRPIKLWAMVLALLQLTMCLTAILGLVFRRGPERASWTGFAVFGWGYLILLIVVTWGSAFVNSPFSFTQTLGESVVNLLGFFMLLGQGETEKLSIMADIVGLVTAVDDASRFLVACSILGLAFAVLGGMIARVFYSIEAASTRSSDSSSAARGTGASEPSKRDEPN